MWTKLYNSGIRISEPSSWSRTDLNNMIGVTLAYNNSKVEIYGIGQYWQSDTYMNNMEWGVHGSRLIKRRILKFLDNIHVGQILENNDNSFIINFDVQINAETPYGLVLLNEVPNWYVAEIDILTGKVSTYLSKDRI